MPPIPPAPSSPPPGPRRTETHQGTQPHRRSETGRRTQPRHRASQPRRSTLPRRTALAAGALGIIGAGVVVTRLGGTDSPTLTAPAPSPSTPPSPSPEPASPTPAAQPSGAVVSVDGWSLEEKIGQLLMVGTSATGSATSISTLMTTHHIGGLFLAGRSTAGTGPTRALVDAVAATQPSAHSTPLLVATDQEGGNVQVLRGSGFSSIPTAREQGTWDPAELATRATGWGTELAAAGVTMNLAPVADLVDIADPSSNGPIGHWEREYGHDAATVTTAVTAVCDGLQAAGVTPVIKHFPGLGRVTLNTDVAANVVDSVTTADDASTGVFASLINHGVPAVMVSSAVYSLIDPQAPAVFSPVVVTDVLRTRLGFSGVVITDDVSAAVQVKSVAPAQRAVRAIAAGCDIILASADPSVVPAMVAALTARAQEDAAFAAQIDDAARRVLTLKASVSHAS